MALIDTYSQPLSSEQVAHLLRRTTFGATPAQLKEWTGKKVDEIVIQLLASQPTPAHPTLKDGTTFHNLSWGNNAATDADRNTYDGNARKQLKYWWIGLMIKQPVSIIEKMTLFWQNHFVSTTTEASDARFMYRYLQLMRKYALGNFRQFVIEVSKDPAMLKYLDNDQNTAAKSNENYARELQELFTIGIGNYNEDDVKAAARVLTGWRTIGYRDITKPDIGTEFRISQHDTKDKVFSTFYQNKTIKGRTTATAGEEELTEFIDLILAQKATALFIVRKFYRWFVQAEISEQIEKEVIEPLATIFRKNYEIKPVIEALLKSQHFFDVNLLGSQIKSPLDLVIGTLRTFNYQLPDPLTDRLTFDNATTYFFTRAREQQMEVLEQPSVFGWRPYYDTDFYEIWINSTTLALKGSFTDIIVKGSTSLKLTFDSITLAKNTSNPKEPYGLVAALTQPLFAVVLSDEQNKYLVEEVLMAGQPYYEWITIWTDHIDDPNNNNKKTAVKSRLDRLFTYLLRLAEFQMG